MCPPADLLEDLLIMHLCFQLSSLDETANADMSMMRLSPVSMCQQVLWAPIADIPSPRPESHLNWVERMNQELNAAVTSCITDVILSTVVGSPFFSPTNAALCLNTTFTAHGLPPRGVALDPFMENFKALKQMRKLMVGNHIIDH